VVLILSTYKYKVLFKTGTCTCTLSSFILNYLYLYLSTFIWYLWHHWNAPWTTCWLGTETALAKKS